MEPSDAAEGKQKQTKTLMMNQSPPRGAACCCTFSPAAGFFSLSSLSVFTRLAGETGSELPSCDAAAGEPLWSRWVSEGGRHRTRSPAQQLWSLYNQTCWDDTSQVCLLFCFSESSLLQKSHSVTGAAGPERERDGPWRKQNSRILFKQKIQTSVTSSLLQTAW